MVKVRYNPETDTYMLIDGSTEMPCKVNKDYRDGPIIKLPKNSLGRAYLLVSAFNRGQVDNEVELAAPREKMSFGTIKRPTEKSMAKWFDVMTDEEKAQYEAIKAACEARLNDPVYKAKLALEKAKAEYEALLAQQAK